MNFPIWIENEKKPLKKAQLRLKFMLGMATMRRFGKSSVRGLAEHIPYNHSSIFNAIDRGSFTSDMASAIEKVVGRDELRAEWLVNPLKIDAVEA